VVMDHLGAHRPERIRELIEQWGCELLYLPGYSSAHNPIDEAFAEIKRVLRRVLRKAATRSKETLLDATGATLSVTTAEAVQGFFEHAGDRPTGHQL
jgi:transposase